MPAFRLVVLTVHHESYSVEAENEADARELFKKGAAIYDRGEFSHIKEDSGDGGIIEVYERGGDEASGGEKLSWSANKPKPKIRVAIWNENCILAGKRCNEDPLPEGDVTLYEYTAKELKEIARNLISNKSANAFDRRVAKTLEEAADG